MTETASDTAAPANPNRATPSPLALGLLVFLAAMAVYLPSFQADMVLLDDPQYVTRNAYVLYPTWQKVGWVFSEVVQPSTVYGYYQPLTMVSLMLDRVIEGWLTGGYGQRVDPFVYHFTNILLHGFNAALVFLIAWLLTRGKLIAVSCGLLFAFHPLNVEVVAWVSQRKSLLATFFALIMVLTHVRNARTGRPVWHFATCLAFLAAVLSKPTALFMPLVLLLVDVWPLERFSRKAVVEKIPLFLLAIFAGWFAYQSQVLAVDRGHRPLDVTLLMVGHNLVFYLAKIVLPIRLCPIYVMPDEAEVVLRSPPFLAGAIGTAALLGVLIWSVRHRKLPVWTLLTIFLLLIGPTLTPVRFMNAIAADRFAYTPMIALILMLAAWMRARTDGSSQAANALGHRGRTAAVAGAIVLALFAVQTTRQQSVWQNSQALYAAVLDRFPDSAEAHYAMGNVYLNEYELHTAATDEASDDKAAEALERAVEHYHKTLELSPDFSNAYYRLGHLLILHGQTQQGIEVIQQGLATPGADPDGLYFLGLAYTHLGDYERAIEPYLICLERQPSWTEVRKNLANALLRTGRAADSLEHYQRLHELNPADLDGLQNWSVALLTVGHVDEAVEKLRHVVRIREMLLVAQAEAAEAASALADAQFTLAGALAIQGAGEEALSHLDAAAMLKPELLDQAIEHPAFVELVDTPGWRMLMEKHGRPLPSN